MTDFTVGGRTAAEYIRGALYGLAAVTIWSGWIVVARLGLRTSLTPWDIAALRFGVAGLLLLPYVMRRGLAIERLGWIGLAAIVIGGSAPVLLANAGLLFAPAAHAGALFPGVMPLAVALLAAAILHEPFADTKKIGFVLILLGGFGMPGAGGARLRPGDRARAVSRLRLGRACYTVAMRYARLDGLHAAGLAAVGTFAFMPGYFSCGTISPSPMGRSGASSDRAGASDGYRFTGFLRTGGQHPRRLQRCRVRRAVPGDDCCHGNSNSG